MRLEVNYPSFLRYYKGVRRTLLPRLSPDAVDGRCPAPKGASDVGGLAASLKRCPDSRPNDTSPNDTRPGLSTPYISPVCLSPACLTAVCLTIGLLAALIGCYGSAHPGRIGTNAPDFTVQDSDHKITLSQFRGQVVVLNFWGTFCPPCVEETPSLVQMQKRFKDKGLVVLAVSIDVDDAAYHKFLKDFNVNMVTVRDGDQKASTLYGTFGWPETYVIDRQGVIRRKFIGAVDWTSPEITDYLSKL